MLTINPTLYERLAELLVEKIEFRTYYSDIITLEDQIADYSFSATLMLYLRDEEYCGSNESVITDIVPIWWEFHSTTEDGEQLNDFDFKILKQIICR